ncbi:hypothetical protein BCR43DRAFT_490459, partial [Syncephalastrum racemosum]
MRLKGWIAATLFVIVLYVSFTLLNMLARAGSPSGSNYRSDIVTVRNNPFRRLNTTRLAVLTSVLAHIQSSYVANRTPDFDTPPLLAVYHCQECGPIEHQFTQLTNAYMFALLGHSTAFATDTAIQHTWFFEAHPAYMSMTPDQARFYRERAAADAIVDLPSITPTELETSNIRGRRGILQSGAWANYTHMLPNPSVVGERDMYQLTQLSTSEVFWVVHQLLFSRPSPWLSAHLEPYRDLMGGVIHQDPLSFKATDIQQLWTRVGVHLPLSATEKAIDAIATRAVSICNRASVMGKACHIFVATESRNDQSHLHDAIRTHARMIPKKPVVHAIAEGYPYPSSPANSDVKLNLARSYMSWTLLSRMDALVGVKD